jgi:hypothetical protein
MTSLVAPSDSLSARTLGPLAVILAMVAAPLVAQTLPFAPVITAQPQSLMVTNGGIAGFNVTASGLPPLGFSWQKDGAQLTRGVVIPGVSDSTLVIGNVTYADAGTFSVSVSSFYGSVVSSNAVLVVLDITKPTVTLIAPHARLPSTNVIFTVNGSARDDVQVSNVWCRVNRGEWNVAATTNGWVNWSSVVRLSPGKNVVDAYALDTSGNSSLTNSITLVQSLFVQVKGTYRGLFFETNGVSQQSSGSFTMTVAANGAFSGTLQLAGTRNSISGRFDSDGNASTIVVPPGFSPLNVNLQLDPESGSGRITGVVSNETWAAELAGDRAVFNARSDPAPQAGHYTMIIPGNYGSTTEPGGDGFGAVTVDASGRLRLAGSLADGTRISQAAQLSRAGQWPLYLSLYSGQGSLLSWITFADTPTNDLSGGLSWIKAGLPKAKYYPGGFTNEAIAWGSHYIRPVLRSNVLNSTNVDIVLSGGDLPQTITNYGSLGFGGRITSTNNAALSFILVSGAFRGKVVDSGHRPISFAGVVLTNYGVGSGYFLGTNRSGRVELLGR